MLATASSMTVQLGSISLTLLPAKAVWYRDEQTLFIADTHFGKAATMRRAGLPIPSGTTAQTLQRLGHLVNETMVNRLVVLGDLIHSAVSAQDDFESELRAWRQRHSQLKIILVKGNHDRREANFYEQLDIETVTEPHCDREIELCHDVRAVQDDDRVCLGGHLHPGIMLKSLSRQPLPCFYRQRKALTLPAFGTFTGCARVQPTVGETCYAVAEDLLVQVDGSTIS